MFIEYRFSIPFKCIYIGRCVGEFIKSKNGNVLIWMKISDFMNLLNTK